MVSLVYIFNKCFKILYIFRSHGLNGQAHLKINTVDITMKRGKFDSPSVILKINYIENNFSHIFRKKVLMFYQTFKLFVTARYLENLRHLISSSSRADFGEDNTNVNSIICGYLGTSNHIY
jgi:hypothetical protein